MGIGILTIAVLISMVKCGSITVTHGEIRVVGYQECVFTSNGITYNYHDGLQVPGLWFGLINYKCDMEVGNKISKFECKNCGIFCVYNELIPGCKQTLFPVLIGCIIGAILGGLMCFLIVKFGNRCFGSLYYRYIKRSLSRSDDKVIKWTKRGRRAGCANEININFKNNGIKSKKYSMKLEQERRDKINNAYKEEVESEYITINNKQSSSTPSSSDETVTPSAPLYPELPPLPVYSDRRSSVTSVGKMVAAGFILANAASIAKCCDQTLFISSDGNICDQNECKNIKMYNFPLLTGQSICFKDSEGEILDIKIHQSYYLNRYSLEYLTSDIEVETDSYWRCKGAGQCWEDGCGKGIQGDQFSNVTSGEIHGYDCYGDGMGCDTWCHHRWTCTYIKWIIKEVGERYPVYRLYSSIWEIQLSLTYKGIQMIKKLNVNNPTVNIDGTDLKNIKELPIYITSFTSENEEKPSNILLIDKTAIGVRASELNFPVKGTVGEYQIDLRKNSRTYDIEGVDCSAASCKPRCTISQPQIQRIRSMTVENMLIEKYVKIGSDRVVEVTQRVKSMANVMIGNIDINNLQVIPAKCTIDLVMTYACEGCKIDPYAIFKPYNIKKEGIVPFDSNCTFDRKYLSCNSESYSLVLKDESRYCSIYLIPFNKTINLNFNFIFTGSLVPYSMTVSRDNSDFSIKELIKTPSFVFSFMSTITGFTAFGMVGALILRVLKIYGYSKESKKVIDNA